MVAEMSGNYRDWAVNIVAYKCSKCGKTETEKYLIYFHWSSVTEFPGGRSRFQ